MSVNTASPAAKSKTRFSTRAIAAMAMLAAIAYVVMWISKAIPSVSGFLDFDFKHVVICIGGFLFGPLPAAIITVAVAFVEMFTVGNSGFYGFIMNVLGTTAFCCTASAIYQKRRTKKGAVLGLSLALCLTVVVMLLWNYFIIPLYNPYVTREAVVGMMLSVLLPFNLAKAGMNMAATLLLYKPVVTALRKANLAPASQTQEGKAGSSGLGMTIFAVVLLIVFTAVALFLILK